MSKATIVLATAVALVVLGAAAAFAVHGAMVEIDPVGDVALDGSPTTVAVTGSATLPGSDGVCAFTSLDVRVDGGSLLGGGTNDPAGAFGWDCGETGDWAVDWTASAPGTYEVIAETVVESEAGSASQMVRQDVVVTP